MNFVLICIDTLRYDHLSCHGNNWIRTPNLQAFANQAMVFENAYAGSLMTVPMRTDMIRGRSGQPFHPWLPLGFDWPTLPRVLVQAGWATMLVCDTPHLINGAHGFDWPFNAWHFERGSEVDLHLFDDQGLDEKPAHLEHYSAHEKRTLCTYMRNNRHRRDEDDWQVAKTFRHAGECLMNNKGRDRFLLWIDTFELHEPWLPPEEYVGIYDDSQFDRNGGMTGFEPVDRLSQDELRHVCAHYAGEVSLLDEHIGRFLECLHASGHDRDTTVIITSDHGANLGAHGMLGKGPPFYEQIAHEVLLVRVPGVEPGRCTDLVQPADIMPTILELGEADVPDTCQGASFVPALTGGPHASRDVAVTGSSRLADKVAVQDRDWCLIDSVLPEQRELYDKRSDPEQRHNVIDQHDGEAKRLHAALIRVLAEREAHPGLINAYETGCVAGEEDFLPVPDYLRNFRPYWEHMLSAE